MKVETDEHLKAIFANVNDWLKFAETKSSILIAADAAASVGALAVLMQNWNQLASFWIVYLHSFIFFVVVSAVVALFAIIPRTAAILAQGGKEKPNEDDNFLFTGHLAKYEPIEFLTKLKRRQDDSSEHSSFQLDYAQQIVVNSCIATTKFNLFRYACWFGLTAITTPILSLPLFLFFNNLHNKFLGKIKGWRARIKYKKSEANNEKEM